MWAVWCVVRATDRHHVNLESNVFNGHDGNDLDVQTALAREYLTFRLGEEEYGIDILKVQEIRGYENPTRIANAPHFLKGVVNLRGTIVPIVDLRLRFGCSSAEYNSFTVSISCTSGSAPLVHCGRLGERCDGDPGRGGSPGTGNVIQPSTRPTSAAWRKLASAW
jgi:hypothetical protein